MAVEPLFNIPIQFWVPSPSSPGSLSTFWDAGLWVGNGSAWLILDFPSWILCFAEEHGPHVERAACTSLRQHACHKNRIWAIFYVHYMCIILCDVPFADHFLVFQNNSRHPTLCRTPEEQPSSRWIFCSQSSGSGWLTGFREFRECRELLYRK